MYYRILCSCIANWILRYERTTNWAYRSTISNFSKSQQNEIHTAVTPRVDGVSVCLPHVLFMLLHLFRALCRCAGRSSCVTCDIGEAQLDWFRGLSWWTLYRWHTGALTFIYFGNSPENHLSKVFFNVEKTQATYEKVLGGHCRPTVGPTSRLHVVMFQALTERC